MVKVVRGIIKANGRFYHKGQVIKKLSKALKAELIESGMVCEVYEVETALGGKPESKDPGKTANQESDESNNDPPPAE